METQLGEVFVPGFGRERGRDGGVAKAATDVATRMLPELE